MTNRKNGMSECPQITSTGDLRNEVSPTTPDIALSDTLNPLGLEQFDEVVGKLAVAAKNAGAKSVKINCYLCGEIIF